MTGIKILIVEDDKITSLVLKQMLYKKNYKVTAIAVSGNEAFISIEKEIPDIILMDIMLEGELDGIKTYSIISKKYNIPVIYMSSYGEHQGLLHSALNGSSSFLLKPLNENELFISIEIGLYRHKADTIIQNNQRQLKMLADFSPDIIILTDLQEKTTVYINKTELFGYPKDEFLSLKPDIFFYDEDYKRLRTFWRHVTKSFGKQPPSIDVRIKCKDNTHLEWINLRQSIIEKDNKGRKKLLMTVISNITEKKNAEIDLIKTNFELDNFIYRASHDLSAPLKSIIGLVNLIKMDREPVNHEKYLDLINRSASKMDSYILDMTNYARNNRLEVENEVINFEEIYRSQINYLKEKEGFNRIQKIFSLNQTSDFISDALRISIIFNNLLSNAIKFQNFNKTDSSIKVAVTVTPESALFVFADNGTGIKKQYLEKIFDMFYRANENVSGSGLGLYIVKQITHKLGGTIDLESSHGIGTVATITLPNRMKFISRY